MNFAFLKREWGAVTFVLTVVVGAVVVPVALYFGNQSQAGAADIGPVASPTPTISASPSVSPSATPSSSPSPSPSATPTPGH